MQLYKNVIFIKLSQTITLRNCDQDRIALRHYQNPNSMLAKNKSRPIPRQTQNQPDELPVTQSPIIPLIRDDVTKVSRDLHPTLFTIGSISHAEALFHSSSARQFSTKSSPVPKAMLRALVSLLRWRLPFWL